MPNLTNVVQESSDYEQFVFLETNREQSRGHIEALKTAYEEIGNLTRVQPILVNDRYEIIDGQHRFIACKELGLPIYFTQVPGLGVAEARSINILHRGWTADDFAKSYAASGDVNYQTYLQLREDYGFSHSVMLAYLYPTDIKGHFRSFRNGELVIEDEEAARERLDRLAELGEYTKLVNNREFALAVLRASKAEGYDQRRMVRKVRLHGDSLLKRWSSVEDNMRMLEEIYNYAMQENSRIRLY